MDDFGNTEFTKNRHQINNKLYNLTFMLILFSFSSFRLGKHLFVTY